MAEPERFFASPAFGDVGTPSAAATSSQTPKKKKKSTTFAPPTTTATPGKIKKKKKGNGGGSSGGIAKDPTGVLAIKKIQRPLPGFNLAGRPGFLIGDGEGKEIKSLTFKCCRPLNQATINTDSSWTFVVQSNKKEFIRFFANSLTCFRYSVYPTPGHDAASAVPATAAVTNSTRALGGTPTAFFDPSVM